MVCDDLRLEVAKKTSILGFLGIAPDIEILLQDFSQPLQRLSFLLLAGPGEGKFRVSVQLLDQDGRSIAPQPEEPFEMPLIPAGKRSMFGFGFARVKFPRPGTYRLVLLVDGESHYETTFAVAQGKPEDFR